MSARDQFVFRPELITTGVVDADAMLLGRSSILPWLVGADHDGRGRRRRSTSCPTLGASCCEPPRVEP